METEKQFLKFIDEPTDLVITWHCLTHMEPWSIDQDIFITDDFCPLKINTIEVESEGYCSIIPLEIFNEILYSKLEHEELDNYFEETETHIDYGCYPFIVLPSFSGDIYVSGDHSESNHNNKDICTIQLPKETIIESLDMTCKRFINASKHRDKYIHPDITLTKTSKIISHIPKHLK
jgi:hypothetical protein